jgi:hypothetical protein
MLVVLGVNVVLEVVNKIPTDIEIGLEPFRKFPLPSFPEYMSLHPLHDMIILALLEEQLKAQIQKHELKNILLILLSHILKHFEQWILHVLREL